MRIQFIFKWFDFWVGLFWDQKKKWLYILPIPCCGIILKLGNHRNQIVDQMQLPVVGDFSEKLDQFIDWMESNNLDWESGRNEHLILKHHILVAPGQWVAITSNNKILIDSKPFTHDA